MSKFAMVFPGQGSQSIGMLASLCTKHEILIKNLFALGSDIYGCDLFHLMNNGPLEKLNQTEFTQAILLIADVACYKIWEIEQGLRPDYLAGHSLGEYAALVCAGVLDLADAIKLVRIRAQLMQQAVPAGTGAMAAILGLDFEIIEDICAELTMPDYVVAPANINTELQTVISGHAAAVEKVALLAKQQGAKRVVMLPVSVPSHCSLMNPIEKPFSLALDKVNWQLPLIPIMHNFDLKSHFEISKIKQALIMQLSNPVRWLETIEKLISLGVTDFAECGPGQVLTGLNTRINSEVNCVSLSNYDNMRAFLQQSKFEVA